MLDTVTIRLNSDFARNTDLLAEIPCHLSGIELHTKEDGNGYVSGNRDNLKIFVSNTGVTIKGSVSKYFFGNNFQSLQRSDIRKAIEKISDGIHLPMKEGKVTRLDIAHNFVTKLKPINYFDILGDCRYFTRLTQPNSLYYQNGRRVKLFYDKIEETKTKTNKDKIPVNWQNKHVLRYEYRVLKRVNKQLYVIN